MNRTSIGVARDYPSMMIWDIDDGDFWIVKGQKCIGDHETYSEGGDCQSL